MNDMTATIIAKSDQINAADLIGISRTVTVKEVRIKAGEDQPVTMMIEEDRKAFRPCKGVRRLIVRVWGPDANKYIGQSMTLFCDPTVTWAGKEEGGIRVSHMTGLDEKIVEYMRVSRAATKPYTILPLRKEPQADTAAKWADTFITKVRACTDLAAIEALEAAQNKRLTELKDKRPELHADIEAKIVEQRMHLAPDDGREGKPADAFGDGFTDESEPWEA